MSSSKCKLFKWANDCKTQGTIANKERPQANKPTLSSAQEITAYFKSQNVSLYCECHLLIKKKTPYNKKDKYRYSKRHLCDNGDIGPGKTTMYLELSRRETSTAYSKDDIWIISKTLTFEKHSTFIGKSTYFGPYSSGELELSPISGYSPSKWRSGDTVFALHGCNAANELMCIENIDENVKSPFMPLLPRLLFRSDENMESFSRQHSSRFLPPTRCSSRNLDISADFAFGLAEETIQEFHLNMDQAAALYDCAGMFSSDDNDGLVEIDISLIHGVFGAGKSYLLAVMIVYLVKLFNTTEHKPKILVSSTTNVAVDRILLGLLDIGFEEFVRVGSVRKIAKKLLPYSMHGSGSSSEEIKELQAMMKEDLEPSEKMHIKKSIAHHRKGGNKQRLTGVPVVGVTCAACVFPCLEKMKFHVLLLDECSQMTEPAALLPLARFGCHKLVLVGDPQQLSPTIQGSQSNHDDGLEQTMFDRLVKMGYKTTLLRTQYRCHPVISAVANRLFYGGCLKNGVSEEDRAPIVEFAPTLCFYDVTRGKEKCGQDGSYYNEEEAKFVVFLIGCFLESGLEAAQIGVITLYKSQLWTISSYLTQSETAAVKKLKSVQISTVDAFQGGEKDVILLSCVRTEHVGFIDCDRRTNVALTRAKRHLLIVGNQHMLSSNKMWSNVIQHCKGQKGGLVTARDFQQSWLNDTTGEQDNTTVLCDQEKLTTQQIPCRRKLSKEESVKPSDFDDSDPILVVDGKEFNNSLLNDDDELEDFKPVIVVEKEFNNSPNWISLEDIVERDEDPMVGLDENYSKPQENEEKKSNHDDDDDKEFKDINKHKMINEPSDEELTSKHDFTMSNCEEGGSHYDDKEFDEVIIDKKSEGLSFDDDFINRIGMSENNKEESIYYDDEELNSRINQNGITVMSEEQHSLNKEFNSMKPLQDTSGSNVHCCDIKANNKTLKNRMPGMLSCEELSPIQMKPSNSNNNHKNGSNLDGVINNAIADGNEKFGLERGFKVVTESFSVNENKICYSDSPSNDADSFNENKFNDGRELVTKPFQQNANGKCTPSDSQQLYQKTSPGSYSEEFSCQTIKTTPNQWETTPIGSSTKSLSKTGNLQLTDGTIQSCPGFTTKAGYREPPATDSCNYCDEDDLPFFNIFSSMN